VNLSDPLDRDRTHRIKTERERVPRVRFPAGVRRRGVQVFNFADDLVGSGRRRGYDGLQDDTAGSGVWSSSRFAPRRGKGGAAGVVVVQKSFR
jgi:hypothetical protein